MITFANLYKIVVQTDGLCRIEFKAADPTQQDGPTTTSVVYMKFTDVTALSKSLVELVDKELARQKSSQDEKHN